jgi:hypothetical protein
MIERLEWDTLLQAAYLADGSEQARLGAVAVCKGRTRLGGIALKTQYVSFRSPELAAVKMLNRPPFFDRFAASIRHGQLSAAASSIEYKYHFTARPRWLRFILQAIMNRLFAWETRKRLRALRRFFLNGMLGGGKLHSRSPDRQPKSKSKGDSMKTRGVILLSVGLWILAVSSARAHFLFIHIGPPAEAGRAVEVYFSEQAEAGDPRFIEKIAHTRLWMQTASGQLQEVKTHKGADRLRAYLPAAGSVVVAGSCEYGVLARPEQTPFLLRYYPKAIAGKPADLKRLQPCGKTPVEIVATVEGDRLKLAALQTGKPIPRATFHTVDAQLANEEVIADSTGTAVWTPKTPGRYSVYTRVLTKVNGESGKQKYEEIREFATLAFSWPLDPKGADKEAVARFQEALAARAMWKSFPGFRARLSGEVDGRSIIGTLTVASSGAVEIKSDESAVQSWVKDQLESLAMHRGAGETARGSAQEPAPVLRYGEEREDHPLGRLLIFDSGRFASSYRVKDKQILVVNRFTDKQNFTITVLDNERNREGKFLPRSYVVHYWDAATGALRRTEAIQDRWQRVGEWDLPTRHTVTTATDGGLSVREFTLTEHQVLPGAKDTGAAGSAPARKTSDTSRSAGSGCQTG